MIVILYPIPDPLSRLLKTPKLRPHQKLLIHRLPKPLDLPQRHRMMGLGFNVFYPVLSQLPLEPRRPPPVRVLPPPVRQHLLRHPVFPNCPPVHLNYLIRRLAPVQLQPHHVPRIIIHHPHQIRIPTPQAKGKDISLPHLVRCGPLEKPRSGYVAGMFLPGGNNQRLFL